MWKNLGLGEDSECLAYAKVGAESCPWAQGHSSKYSSLGVSAGSKSYLMTVESSSCRKIAEPEKDNCSHHDEASKKCQWLLIKLLFNVLDSCTFH